MKIVRNLISQLLLLSELTLFLLETPYGLLHARNHRNKSSENTGDIFIFMRKGRDQALERSERRQEDPQVGPMARPCHLGLERRVAPSFCMELYR